MPMPKGGPSSMPTATSWSCRDFLTTTPTRRTRPSPASSRRRRRLCSGLDERPRTGGPSPETGRGAGGLGRRPHLGPEGLRRSRAFEREERSQALDLLGFDKQWVFASFSTGQIFHIIEDPEVAARRAPTTGAWRSSVAPIPTMGVGATALDDPDAAWPSSITSST